eukprot:624232-Pelagomonas_calceolata.AAC.1
MHRACKEVNSELEVSWPYIGGPSYRDALFPMALVESFSYAELSIKPLADTGQHQLPTPFLCPCPDKK